ncbi:hypothetical protein [Lusitaniella coriacea]|uniref:hypothetical protein n=1 Tax=Lusitaniella coriacea TaxID=1983105 RepID=UPI003CF58123
MEEKSASARSMKEPRSRESQMTVGSCCKNGAQSLKPMYDGDRTSFCRSLVA